MKEMSQMDSVRARTFFAPAERASSEELARQIKSVMDHPITEVILQAVSGYILILNQNRQVLAANQALLDALGTESSENFTGLRPGEIFECSHVPEGPGGCGTSPHCQTCGAVLSILICQAEGLAVEKECRMSIEKGGQFQAADFKVRSSPLNLGNLNLIIVVLQDISSFKRREILEKVFLHDFFNTVGGIQGWSEQLTQEDPETAARQILLLSTQLKEEMQFHSFLRQAEYQNLEIDLKPASAREIIEHLRTTFFHQAGALEKHIQILPMHDQDAFYTDPFLLLRILINMVKNALEATPAGGNIQISYEIVQRHPTFRVHNDSFIPANIQDHIFERSYSTKGEGRGVGTYSMRLFGEQYLKGRVSFTSTPTTGTTFSMELPDPDTIQQAGAQIQSSLLNAEGAKREMDDDKKVLLVDDDESHAMLGGLLLERLGFNVQISHNGEDAVQIFQNTPDAFFFVMTDYTMMPLNGLDTARRLLEINPSAIILLCTGRDDPALIREARSAGVRAVALKPSNREEMEDLLVSAGLFHYID
jgi:CheY-like chemotaxis protein